MGIYVYKIHLSGKIFQIAVSFDRLSNILIGQHAFRTKRLVKYFGDKRNKRKIFFVPISKILVPTAFRMYIQFFLKLWYWAVSYFLWQHSFIIVKSMHQYCKWSKVIRFFSCQKPFLWKCCKISCVRSHHSRLAMDYSGFFWLYVNIVIYSFKSHSEKI